MKTEAELIEMGEGLSDLRFARGFLYDRTFADVVRQGLAASEFAAALRDCSDPQAVAEARKAETGRMFWWHAVYEEFARQRLKRHPIPWITV